MIKLSVYLIYHFDKKKLIFKAEISKNDNLRKSTFDHNFGNK